LPVNVMPEGKETQGDEPDFLAERRARRAAESGELALTRRAEAAEATVETLERHVASLRERLGEAEDERKLAAELLEAEKEGALEREHELRRVKQREYAEQQLRVEAEEGLAGLDRESRAEIERLHARLDAGEREAAELGGLLDALQRQLAEAEHSATAERAAVQRAGQELQARLGELERRTSEMQHGLAAERAARERSERLLEGMREGYLKMESLLGGMRGLVERLTSALTAEAERRASVGVQPTASPLPIPPAQPQPQPQLRERLAPGQSWPARQAASSESSTPDPAAEARGAEMAEALAAAVERLRARAEVSAAPVSEPTAPAALRPPHKHSMSLIGRWRNRRKQRRGL
jgi:hypothetical protein